MCGISFIIGRDASDHKINEMVKVQHHRGPDARDTCFYPEDKVALGFNRLSIIDVSDSGMQPMRTPSGRYTLVFNGEIYNYKEIREQLSDYNFTSSSDSEVLLAAWDMWGADCLPKLIGMFGLAVWDHKAKTLTVARDWIGIKPLYFGLNNQTIYGASEIKALLAVGVPFAPDWEIWGDYFRYGVYNHRNRTFFKDIVALDPAHYMVITAKDAEKGQLPKSQSYWDLESAMEVVDHGKSEENLAEELWQRLEESVRLHLRSDVKLGLNLSGGMDSATLCLLMDQLADKDVPLSSYTIGYGEPQYDEIIYADLIPKNRSWDRHEVVFKPQEAAANFNDDIYSFEEPIGGVATQAYKKLHKYAHDQGVKVLLEGQGVDEMLGGYGYYKSLLNEKNTAQSVTTDGTTPLFYQDNTRFLAPELLLENGPVTETSLRDFKTPFGTAVENAMYADLFHRRVPRVLRMNDRLSMAHSVELREPFLTARLAEFCYALPYQYKVKPHQSKSILKTALEKRAPEFAKTCEQKRAVSAPQREWLRDELKDLAWDLLKSKSFIESGVFDVPRVHQAYEDYVAHGAENSFFIWQWMNFAAWMKVFKA